MILFFFLFTIKSHAESLALVVILSTLVWSISPILSPFLFQNPGRERGLLNPAILVWVEVTEAASRADLWPPRTGCHRQSGAGECHTGFACSCLCLSSVLRPLPRAWWSGFSVNRASWGSGGHAEALPTCSGLIIALSIWHRLSSLKVFHWGSFLHLPGQRILKFLLRLLNQGLSNALTSWWVS